MSTIDPAEFPEESPYMVIPRKLAAQMPQEWCDRFSALLRELNAHLDTQPTPVRGYIVQAFNENREFILDPDIPR